jgi:microcystin-dependent protein
MANPYLGEIRTFAFSFAPIGWAMCNGQLLSISENTALFALLGTDYGGNGTTTFALPNLQSRVPIHMGQGSGLSPYVIGQLGGTETVTLLNAQMPTHTHLVNADGTAGSGAYPKPTGRILGSVGDSELKIYSPEAPTVTMNPAMIANAGSSQPHTNIQPYLVVNCCIALSGIFPSRA